MELRNLHPLHACLAAAEEREKPCLHGQDIVAAHALEDLGHVVQADAHAEVAVAAEVLKAVRAQLFLVCGALAGVHNR